MRYMHAFTPIVRMAIAAIIQLPFCHQPHINRVPFRCSNDHYSTINAALEI